MDPRRVSRIARLRRCWLPALAAALLVTAACARKKTVRAPAPPAPSAVEIGIASWYGYPYHGRRAANGEVYDMEKLTAAHRTLPFGTWVEVLNLSNDKRVVVRINDRGPFVEGRIIDLSRAAARQIDMIGPGIVKVRLQVTAPPRDLSARDLFAVQVGAFENRSNAQRLEQSLRARYPSCRLVRRESSSPPWRVLVGSESSPEAAGELARELRREFGAAFVVRLDEPARSGL